MVPIQSWKAGAELSSQLNFSAACCYADQEASGDVRHFCGYLTDRTRRMPLHELPAKPRLLPFCRGENHAQENHSDRHCRYRLGLRFALHRLCGRQFRGHWDSPRRVLRMYFALPSAVDLLVWRRPAAKCWRWRLASTSCSTWCFFSCCGLRCLLRVSCRPSSLGRGIAGPVLFARDRVLARLRGQMLP
ncbi:MAG: hypothetical protein JWQ07_101 [Ramlibacter sp.]|nr:hypothetical protein [Ramlibacter sp.]